MKFKTTARDVRNGYKKVFSLGYCEWSNMLKYENPVAYTCGVYGWNFDVYEIDGVAITTGYRGMVGSRFPNSRELEKKAEEINCMRNISYDERKEMVQKLLRNAVHDALAE